MPFKAAWMARTVGAHDPEMQSWTALAGTTEDAVLPLSGRLLRNLTSLLSFLQCPEKINKA